MWKLSELKNAKTFPQNYVFRNATTQQQHGWLRTPRCWLWTMLQRSPIFEHPRDGREAHAAGFREASSWKNGDLSLTKFTFNHWLSFDTKVGPNQTASFLVTSVQRLVRTNWPDEHATILGKWWAWQPNNIFISFLLNITEISKAVPNRCGNTIQRILLYGFLISFNNQLVFD